MDKPTVPAKSQIKKLKITGEAASVKGVKEVETPTNEEPEKVTK